MDCSTLGFAVLSPRLCSNSRTLSQGCHPTISSSVAPSSPALFFPSIRVFFNESVLRIRWPKYWSFSISPSNEYSELISFRMDLFDLLAAQGLLKCKWPYFILFWVSVVFRCIHAPSIEGWNRVFFSFDSGYRLLQREIYCVLRVSAGSSHVIAVSSSWELSFPLELSAAGADTSHNQKEGDCVFVRRFSLIFPVTDFAKPFKV